ncbi:MAG: hypothetical protein ACT4OS_11840 [Acidimicrobiales bacterium]
MAVRPLTANTDAMPVETPLPTPAANGPTRHSTLARISVAVALVLVGAAGSYSVARLANGADSSVLASATPTTTTSRPAVSPGPVECDPAPESPADGTCTLPGNTGSFVFFDSFDAEVVRGDPDPSDPLPVTAEVVRGGGSDPKPPPVTRSTSPPPVAVVPTGSTASVVHGGAGASVPLAEMGTVRRTEVGRPDFQPPARSPEPIGFIRETDPPTRNQVTDEDRWLADRRILEPTVEATKVDKAVPRAYQGLALVGITRTQPVFALYGQGFTPTIAVEIDLGQGTAQMAYDFTSFTRAPRAAPDEVDRVDQGIRWISRVGPVLYVAHAHLGYAAASDGANGFLTAIDTNTGRILWRSPSLVANADLFTLVNGVIFTGYGFTAEADFLYALDAKTGKVLGRQPLITAPTFIVRQGDELHIRTYDHDYEFEIDLKALARAVDSADDDPADDRPDDRDRGAGDDRDED